MLGWKMWSRRRELVKGSLVDDQVFVIGVVYTVVMIPGDSRLVLLTYHVAGH